MFLLHQVITATPSSSPISRCFYGAHWLLLHSKPFTSSLLPPTFTSSLLHRRFTCFCPAARVSWLARCPTPEHLPATDCLSYLLAPDLSEMPSPASSLLCATAVSAASNRPFLLTVAFGSDTQEPTAIIGEGIGVGCQLHLAVIRRKPAATIGEGIGVGKCSSRKQSQEEIGIRRAFLISSPCPKMKVVVVLGAVEKSSRVGSNSVVCGRSARFFSSQK